MSHFSETQRNGRHEEGPGRKSLGPILVAYLFLSPAVVRAGRRQSPTAVAREGPGAALLFLAHGPDTTPTIRENSEVSPVSVFVAVAVTLCPTRTELKAGQEKLAFALKLVETVVCPTRVWPSPCLSRPAPPRNTG